MDAKSIFEMGLGLKYLFIALIDHFEIFPFFIGSCLKDKKLVN